MRKFDASYVAILKTILNLITAGKLFRVVHFRRVRSSKKRLRNCWSDSYLQMVKELIGLNHPE